MAEHIEREALLRDIERYNVSDGAFQHWVEIQPAADVAPVRHGRWEVGYFHDRVCSCCLHPDNDFDDYAHNFCPNCGAKMDGGADNG